MTGHSPPPVTKIIAEQASRGITLMLLYKGLRQAYDLARWDFLKLPQGYTCLLRRPQ